MVRIEYFLDFPTILSGKFGATLGSRSNWQKAEGMARASKVRKRRYPTLFKLTQLGFGKNTPIGLNI